MLLTKLLYKQTFWLELNIYWDINIRTVQTIINIYGNYLCKGEFGVCGKVKDEAFKVWQNKKYRRPSGRKWTVKYLIRFLWVKFANSIWSSWLTSGIFGLSWSHLGFREANHDFGLGLGWKNLPTILLLRIKKVFDFL